MWLSLLRDIPGWSPPSKRTILIAPHPDDETLGAGGLIAAQCRLGIKVVVVAVTDGEAAYAGVDGLGDVRCVEQQSALAELGVPCSDIIRLGLPDSAVTSREQDLTKAVEALVTPDTLLLAPWQFDPHPDHEACGRAAQRAARTAGCELVSYLFWSWHHFNFERLADQPLRRFELDDELQASRARALAHHRSQLYREDGRPVLPGALLAPARRPFETFIVE